MKNLCLALIATVLFINSYSQQPIQLDSTNMPYVGWTQKTARDTFPLPSVNYGLKGANRTYDFSNLVLFDNDTIEYRALTNPQKTKFSSSNLATTANGVSFLFSKTTATGVTWQGLDGELLPGFSTDVAFNPEPIVAKFPTKYGNTYSGTWGFTKTVAGSAVGQPAVSQVKVTYTGKYTDTIDGWGKVITPHAAYKCLRDQRYETSNTKIEVAIIPNIFSTFSNTFDTTKRYTYLTKEARGSALTFSYDTSGTLLQVAWSLQNPNPPIATFTYSVAPNGVVTFTDSSDNYPNTWSWNYNDNTPNGNTQNPTHTYTSNGNYYVCLTATNAGGSHTFCDTVRVATIGTPNQKPIAINDTVIVFQPNSISIPVLANDSDPDQNALTVSILQNATHGNDTAINSQTILYQPNASYVGFDTIRYTICDNGTPSLCDTAYIFIEVKEPVILPNAAFNYTASTTNCGAVFSNASLHADSVVWKLNAITGITDTLATGDTLNITHTNSTTWQANVCLYAYNKFGVDSSCQQVVITCASINEVEDVVYKIYPNPSADMFFVRNNLPFLMGVHSIRLIDLEGRIVKETAVNENSIFARVSTADIQAGSYVAEVILNNGKVGGRAQVLIQH
ncbi:MAG: Ig-like domain-containing protein [Chitinophagales bacterium]